MSFLLHPNLASKLFLIDLPLCRVLLEDERTYPWLIVVPRLPGLSSLVDLTLEQQQLLCLELHHLQKMMWTLFRPTQLNVAAIGNKTRQLHVHVIARYEGDPAWPGTVWDHPQKQPYQEEERNDRVRQLLPLLEDIRAELTAL